MSYFDLRRVLRNVAAVVLALGSASLPAQTSAPQPVQLTDNGRQKSDLVFIDDGRQLVFTELERFDLLSLQRLTLATKDTDSKVERLHPGAGTSEFGIAFSRNQSHSAWLLNDGNLHVKVVIEEAKTQIRAEHNPGGGFAAIRDLTMAPDASRVVFAFPDSGRGQQLFSLTMDGKIRQPLTDGEAFDVHPQFSPDGEHIAFSSTRDGNFDIWTMKSDGSEMRRLTEHKGLDTRPRWSPDGQRLAFTSLRDGNYDVYVINSRGGGLQRITTHPERDDYACWHPDGKRLAMVSERRGKFDVYLVAVESGEAGR